MTTTLDRGGKRRPRRIAADEAHAWARNLRLGNPHAKLVLSMLTIYVDGNGSCFVGIPALSEDCELAQETVRKRLAWLETIGAVVRVPQWLDGNGRRNSEGRGKRTTDDIRLMIEADIDAIEARALGYDVGEIAPEPCEFSPLPRGGLNPDDATVRTPVGLQQDSSCVEGLISEPEPESPLKVPSGDEREPLRSDEPEPDGFAHAWAAWPGHEVMRRDLALAEYRLLSAEEQRLCRAAVPLFAAMQTKLGRTRVPNFHLWIRTRGFLEFPNAKLPEEAAAAEGAFIVEGSEADRALRFVRQLARQPNPFVRSAPDGSRGYPHKGVVGADLLAMLAFANQTTFRWPIYERGSSEFGAWQGRFREWIGASLPIVPGEGGIHAPCQWPPKKDGTIYSAEVPADGDSGAPSSIDNSSEVA